MLKILTQSLFVEIITNYIVVERLVNLENDGPNENLCTDDLENVQPT